jgi:hypothetical protein
VIQDKWEKHRANPAFRQLHSAIEAGLQNIRKWYRRMDDTDVYILAMVLNPVLKMNFIKATWEPYYVKLATDIIHNAVNFCLLSMQALNLCLV